MKPLRSRAGLALVLGSGGVRSIAALGLADVLFQEGLMPDLIVGCSAGALFGALVCAGHRANEAVAMATTLWSAEVARQRRWWAIPQMLLPRLGRFDADFAMRDDSLIMARLRTAFGDARLEDLRIPLRVCTTDATTGSTQVLTEGSVVDALRASIAMPFMFRPVQIGGQRLVDGFVSDPLPVSAARDAAAVVTLGFAAPMPHRVDRPSRLLAQVTSAMTNNLVEARLAAARAGGMRMVNIVPRLENRVGLFDTAAMPHLVQVGRQAAREALPAIRHLLGQGPRLAIA
jgi:NTE family protein